MKVLPVAGHIMNSNDDEFAVEIHPQTEVEQTKKRPRRVTFNSSPPKIHIMVVWDFAYRQARKSDWMIRSIDRYRFQRKIKNEFQIILEPILDLQHRLKVANKIALPFSV